MVKRAVPFVDRPLGATEDRVIGSLDLERALRSGEKAFEPGLLAKAHRGFLYIDEINLLEDHLVDLLLDVAASGENVVEREGLSVRHPAKFVLIGSGNPEEGELRPQLLDRFGLSVEVSTPTELSERIEIVRSLRLGEIDVLVGINLLREGLDIPEVSLVAILDADKEGFLRAERSLIQTIGRAARNVRGTAILYADRITDSMRRAIDETERRRARQLAHNTALGIVPRSVSKQVRELIDGVVVDRTAKDDVNRSQSSAHSEAVSEKDLGKRIKLLEKQMLDHARNLEFEKAARVRDQLAALKEQIFGASGRLPAAAPTTG
jgi:superfamily II DNA or RNA helicase